MAAICTPDALGQLADPLLIGALRDPHPRVRERAVLLAEGRGAPGVVAAAVTLANDPDAKVWGNGKATAVLLARQGAKVYGTDVLASGEVMRATADRFLWRGIADPFLRPLQDRLDRHLGIGGNRDERRVRTVFEKPPHQIGQQSFMRAHRGIDPAVGALGRALQGGVIERLDLLRALGRAVQFRVHRTASTRLCARSSNRERAGE